MKPSTVCFIMMLLTGCGTNTVVETVHVDVPVPVPCVDSGDVPVVVPSASNELTIDSTPGDKIKAVLIERERLRQSDTEFRAIIQGCLL